MACPRSAANLEYLCSKGIYHLVSLSEETLPPINKQSAIEWTIIPVEEFEAPLLDDIIKFIDICSKCLLQNKALGVHCRQGRGRTGVMGACCLIKFQNLSPDQAILDIRDPIPEINCPPSELLFFRGLEFGSLYNISVRE
ncbi:dual specificity protein phosphatase 23-like isoform X2 [Diabrotica virgifera virgifera]|uniref:Tyrosine specific protein phosphatases domain-containing protein n=1 Tax=Diabrotica virgifera virgifera TaxID=50390 RepID=A0ABM5K4G7_DIAVI|nr:dual specificity protein phosphatase 23-like isoform X2 [Diabrotica virgifera virgifera]